jgi:hypothetical protein
MCLINQRRDRERLAPQAAICGAARSTLERDCEMRDEAYICRVFRGTAAPRSRRPPSTGQALLALAIDQMMLLISEAALPTWFRFA